MMVQGMREFRFETSVSVTSPPPPDVVNDLVADLGSHLDWSGERASDAFKLLTLDAPEGPTTVGTRFASTGASDNGTFHDASVVTEASRPTRFAFETDSRLERTRGKTWEVRFSHRYDIVSDGQGSRIVHTDTVQRVNYVPYWLQPWFRPITRRIIDRADTKQMENLARAA